MDRCFFLGEFRFYESKRYLLNFVHTKHRMIFRRFSSFFYVPCPTFDVVESNQEVSFVMYILIGVLRLSTRTENSPKWEFQIRAYNSSSFVRSNTTVNRWNTVWPSNKYGKKSNSSVFDGLNRRGTFATSKDHYTRRTPRATPSNVPPHRYWNGNSSVQFRI